MPLIFRLVKGAPVTFLEGDDNLRYLEGLAISSSINFSDWTGSILSQFAGTASLALTASYALNAGTTIDTGSLVTTSSFNSFTSSYNTGSFTGSFIGTLIGTSSWAQNAVNANSVPLVAGPGIDINGLEITASVRSVNAIFPTNGNIAIALSATKTGTSASLVAESTASLADGTVWIISGDPISSNNGDAYIYNSGSQQWLQIAPLDQAAGDARYLMLTPQAPLNGDLDLGGYDINNVDILYGTASWAISASWAPPTDLSGYTTTSSFNNFTSSYNTGSFTGSFTGELIGTASWANRATTSSFAESSSRAITASFAESANVFPFTGSAIITGSLNIIGPTTITGSLFLSGAASTTSGVEMIVYNTSSGLISVAPGYFERIDDLSEIVFENNQLVEGTVYWTGIGLNYSASAHIYYIQGTKYTAPPGVITLPASDPILPRIDVIYVDTTGNYGFITGSPDVSPAKPTADPDTQLELTLVNVGAGANEPNVQITNIYLENTEWSSSIVTPGTNTSINFTSSISPFSGSRCIRVTRTGASGVQNASIQFRLTSSLQDFSGRILTFALSSSALWNSANTLTLSLFNGNTQISNTPVVFNRTSYGYNSSIPQWQVVSIPTTAFGLTTQGSGNTLRVTFSNNAWPTASGFNVGLDNIQLQTENTVAGNVQYLTTASAVNNTITFTRGNGSTFNVTVATGSVNLGSYTTTASFNAFTSSYNTGSFTGSFTGSLFGTASWALSASWAPSTSTNTGSLLTTASVSSNTITFTKGDTSQFSITVDTGSGGGGSGVSNLQQVTTAGATTSASFFLTDASSNTIIGLDQYQAGPPSGRVASLKLRTNFTTTGIDVEAGSIKWLAGAFTSSLSIPGLTQNNFINLPNTSSATLAASVRVNGTTYFATTGGLVDIGTVTVQTGSFLTTGSLSTTQQLSGSLNITGSLNLDGTFSVPYANNNSAIGTFSGSNNGNKTIDIINTNSGSNAGIGFRYYNDSGSALVIAQTFLGSTTYVFGSNKYFIDGVRGSLEFISRPGIINFNTVSLGDSNTRMRIFNNGNVGIGNNPVDGGFKLDINGTTRLQNTLTVSAGGANIVGNTTVTGSLDVSGSGRFTNGLTVTGSATITNVLTLPYQDPLPSSPATGSIALSGSGATFVGMFVWTGVWTQI